MTRISDEAQLRLEVPNQEPAHQPGIEEHAVEPLHGEFPHREAAKRERRVRLRRRLKGELHRGQVHNPAAAEYAEVLLHVLDVYPERALREARHLRQCRRVPPPRVGAHQPAGTAGEEGHLDRMAGLLGHREHDGRVGPRQAHLQTVHGAVAADLLVLAAIVLLDRLQVPAPFEAVPQDGPRSKDSGGHDLVVDVGEEARQHLPAPGEQLRECRQLLRPGLLAQAPQEEQPVVRLEEPLAEAREARDDPRVRGPHGVQAHVVDGVPAFGVHGCADQQVAPTAAGSQAVSSARDLLGHRVLPGPLHPAELLLRQRQGLHGDVQRPLVRLHEAPPVRARPPRGAQEVREHRPPAGVAGVHEGVLELHVVTEHLTQWPARRLGQQRPHQRLRQGLVDLAYAVLRAGLPRVC
mmetsp:Transcript_35057/g.98433  ORF Transcript_35057/g.98433 Transcript_35057/m.98433 type:complete len:408 (+) Transcript_35057:307-1530(+)